MPGVIQLRCLGVRSQKPFTRPSGQRQHTCFYLMLPFFHNMKQCGLTHISWSESRLEIVEDFVEMLR